MIKGVLSQVVASFLFAVMYLCVYAAHRESPEASSLVVSFIRSITNAVILIAIAQWRHGSIRGLFGDWRPSLWWRGFFGGLSLILSFAGTQAIGASEAGFLNSSSAIFVAAMAPWALKQRNSLGIWFIVAASTFGMFLLMEPRFTDANQFGRIVSLGSGLAAAIAYILVARVGTSNSPSTIVFYFAAVSVALHLCLLPFNQSPIPQNARYWMFAVSAGLAATAAQYYMTLGYQLTPAVWSAILGYLSPVFATFLSALVYGIYPDQKALWGASIIVSAGMLMPTMRTLFRRRD